MTRKNQIKKPKQIDLLKLAKKAGDEDYLNQAKSKAFHA